MDISYVYLMMRVSYDCAISAVVRREETCKTFVEVFDNTEDCIAAVYAVGGLIGWRDSCDVWAVCKLLVEHESTLPNNEHLLSVSVSSTERVQLVRLSPVVRRAAVIHRCSDTCHVDKKRRTVIHDGSIFNGTIISVVRRSEGYPPRMA